MIASRTCCSPGTSEGSISARRRGGKAQLRRACPPCFLLVVERWARRRFAHPAFFPPRRLRRQPRPARPVIIARTRAGRNDGAPHGGLPMLREPQFITAPHSFEPAFKAPR